MATESSSNKAVLLAIPLGFAVYSYSKNYSLGKGVLVTVLGTLAVGVALGVAEVVYGTYQIANKDYLK
jgi:hypothetical protein